MHFLVISGSVEFCSANIDRTVGNNENVAGQVCCCRLFFYFHEYSCLRSNKFSTATTYGIIVHGSEIYNACKLVFSNPTSHIRLKRRLPPPFLHLSYNILNISIKVATYCQRTRRYRRRCPYALTHTRPFVYQAFCNFLKVTKFFCSFFKTIR